MITQRGSTTFKDDSFLARESMRTVIGGNDVSKFVPNINLSFEAFSGSERYFLNLNRNATIGRGTGIAFDPVAGVRYQTDMDTEDVYSIAPDGSFKWDIVIQRSPASNVLAWTMAHSPGMVFHYQPALSAREIADGDSQPDEITGSYTVRIPSTGHYLDGRGRTLANYRYGKVAHIMRPLCFDSNNVRVWGILDITGSTLTITVPQSFLDAATYPITIDPEFGFPSASTPGTAVGLSGCLATDADPAPYTATAGDTITKYTVYGRRASGNGNCDVIAYRHNGFDPENRLATPVLIDGTPTAAWIDSAAVSHALVGGTDYCLAIGNEDGGFNIYRDSVLGGSGSTSKSSSATLDDPWVRSSGNSHVYGMYATYTTGGGGGAISPASLSSAEAFGAPSLVVGAVAVAPAGVASAENIGAHAVSLGGVSVTPGGLISSEVFGGPTIAPGEITVNPSAIITGEAFGSPALGFIIVPASIDSVEAIGAALVAPGDVPLLVSAIVSLENIGAPLVTNGGAAIAPNAIASAEIHGSAALVPGAVSITPAGLFTTEIFGDTSLSTGNLALLPGGVLSLEAFGGHTLSMGGVFVAPGGVSSLELFGGPTLALSLQLITPNGVASVAALGVPIIIAGTGLQTLKLVEAVQRTFIFHADQRLFIFSQSR